MGIGTGTAEEILITHTGRINGEVDGIRNGPRNARKIFSYPAPSHSQFVIVIRFLRRLDSRPTLLVPQGRLRDQSELLGLYRLVDRLFPGVHPARAVR